MIYLATIWLISIVNSFCILVHCIKKNREKLSNEDFGFFLLTVVLIVVSGPVFLIFLALHRYFLKIIKKD